MLKLDYMALAASGAYLGTKLLASRSQSALVQKAAIRFTDVLVAAQIYIVIRQLREGAAPVAVEVAQAPAPSPQIQSST